MNRQHSLSSSLLRSCRQWQRVSTTAASKPSEIMTLVGLLQGAFGLRIFNAKHRRSLGMLGCMGKSIQRQGQQHGTIRCIKYGFLLVCSSRFVRNIHWFRSRVNQGHWKWCHSIDWYGFLSVFYSTILPDIRLQKWRDLANRDRGPSKSLEMSSFDRAHMTSYWRSIVNMALSRVVSEIFNVEKYRDLEIRVGGHSRSLK